MSRQVAIVQLPFPSSIECDSALTQYYNLYATVFAASVPEFFIPDSGLWEMPLWVAHLTGMIEAEGSCKSKYCDLSLNEYSATACIAEALRQTAPGDLVLMSPLAQNLDLTVEVARALRRASRSVVIGGNMASLVPTDAADVVVTGILHPSTVKELLAKAVVAAEPPVTLIGVSRSVEISVTPDYRHLKSYYGKVPLLRIFASHGCLFSCSFCGDAWSKQLSVVSKSSLRREVTTLRDLFPQTRLIYVGDKTFGQSPAAVENLLEAFTGYSNYKFIVQSHVNLIDPRLIEKMKELGVVVVELGIETADTDLLRVSRKPARGSARVQEAIDSLAESGIKVVANILGGLDEETERSHNLTIEWMEKSRDNVWLMNLYNFVPYPMVPAFESLRPRIFNWKYSDWREDRPPVYRPKHLTPERSWELFNAKVEHAYEILRRAYSEQIK